jgi:ankyrin repeat protein
MYLLCKGADPFTISKNDERTVFHLACFMGHIQSLKIILNYRRHIKRYQLYNNIKSEMKKYNIKKSDVKAGILVSPDRHIK